MWLLVLTSCSNVVEQSDIPYDERYSADVLDVYMPPPAGVPRPAVLVIHGGGWTEGIYRSSLAPHAERLAEAGYVTVNIEYRLTPHGGQFPGAVKDCFCALAWLRAHAESLGVDPTKIAGLGYSAGGHLVSMLGTAAADPGVAPDCAAGPAAPLNAVVSGAGPQDMTLLLGATAVTDFLGGTKDQVPEVYAEASPITHVAVGDPPFLLVGGDNDWFVSIDHAHLMKKALDAVGTETRLFEIPGGGHIWNGADGQWELPLTSIDTPEAQAAILDFLDHTIGPPP
ncbi:MAG: alpha/beta hydrolase [Deltaproteobacteria bacterium]|nr:alpha/beta hydrolase [Deltaproteobacteria bacterium]